MDLQSTIRSIPDFPKPGILFRDITTLLQNSAALNSAIAGMTYHCQILEAEVIVGIESRGFIFGPAIAQQLGLGFVPIRKPGKLPAPTYQIDYELEYGTDTLEVHQDAFEAGQKVVIVDDLIATGGTAAAAAQLVEKAGATLAGYSFLIELVDLKGRSLLPDVPVKTLVAY
ncbi:MAG: adenine phosphoribosyltransferase [Cyanobacteria bacterium P01_D01_bin.73]